MMIGTSHMFPLPDFQGQFIVSRGDCPTAASATRHCLETLCVDVFEPLNRVEVLDASGRSIGLFLGTVIDTDAEEILTSSIRLDDSLDQINDIDQWVEEQIYRLAGSFVFVLDTTSAQRIYLDANGSNSLVYDPQTKTAAATTALLLDPAAYRQRFDNELYRGLTVDEDGWFPAGLTAHTGIRRLMCNHYLDMETMQTVRHWPAGKIEEAKNLSEPVALIVDKVERTIRAIQRTGLGTMALTAGNETRLLLGCCRSFAGDIDFVTVKAPGAELDVTRSRELARRFDLKHRLLEYVEADANGARAWQMRVGHCITGSNMTMHPSVEPLNGRIFIGGLGGEIGRGFLWLNSEQGIAIDAPGIVSRLKLPQHPLLLKEVQRWLEPLRHYDSLFLLDLAYMELRMSCWAFSQSYAAPRIVEVNPLVSRDIYMAMLSVPPSLRRNNGLIVQGIQQTWPELLSLPINRYGDWRDRARIARNAMASPNRAIRKIRQLTSVKLGRMLARRAE
ncbi:MULTISPECIES: hypothetical protein [unclassified Rhizobium]|uniref:hypothetical protein n=1 Tax=unclassified Rhizobium TaxID=2613769 RepID=UPI00181C6177|nr:MULTISPECIES: hypothetical protein [unclassified Rhizobium]MBB3318091.1 hypothetical protein [Rhizobium sp. BK181]MCS4095567.1 hypothetical protein [Rhizobium sp. BK176]